MRIKAAVLMDHYHRTILTWLFRFGEVTFHGTVIAGIGDELGNDAIILVGYGLSAGIVYFQVGKYGYCRGHAAGKLGKAAQKFIALKRCMRILIKEIDNALIHKNMIEV